MNADTRVLSMKSILDTTAAEHRDWMLKCLQGTKAKRPKDMDDVELKAYADQLTRDILPPPIRSFEC
jgi:hypothetical protein